MSTTSAGSPPRPASPSVERLTPGARRALIAAIVGTLIEFYDYALYGAAAGLIITPLFFPESISSAGELAAFATFSVGFVVRPLGGLLVAHIGDRFGRKPAMILTILLMGAATVGIGLLPTAATAGMTAVVLLVLLRMLQGFGAGAELAGAMTVVAEFAPPRRRGFYTGIVLAAPSVGTLLATAAFLVAAAQPKDALLEGNLWRIPFLLSAVLFFLALWIRRQMEETPEYAAAQARRTEAATHTVPLVQLMKASWREVVTGFFAISGHNANYYLLAAFAGSYLAKQPGMTKTSALLAVSIGCVAGIITCPLAGALGDRIGAGRTMCIGAVTGILYAYPFFLALHSGSFWLATAALVFGYGVVMSLSCGAQGAFLANLFPARYRFSGIAMARELNGAVVAGNTPLVAAALIKTAGGSVHLAALALVICFVSSLAAILLGRSGDYPAVEPRLDSARSLEETA